MRAWDSGSTARQIPQRAGPAPQVPGWPREAGLGLATGWAIALVCVLPCSPSSEASPSFSFSSPPPGSGFLADAAFFALAALAEEIAFRGYGFQRFERAVGPIGAASALPPTYAIVQALTHGASHASFAVSVAFSLLLSSAYLRTRALWLSWGLNFGWKASRALLFGLAVSGINSHSPIVQGDPMGPFWLTGGGYGLDASWFTFIILLLALPFVFSITRDLDFIHNAPVIVAGGIPVDLDAAARKQHEAAMGPPNPPPPGPRSRPNRSPRPAPAP
jgi:uncharacterized protein